MKQNNKFEILTSQGFKDFEALVSFTASEFYRIEFENGSRIEVTPNHIFFNQNGDQIKVSQLIQGYQLAPNMKVSKIQLINNEEKRFININSVKSSKEEYLTSDGLMHHNCGGKCIVLSTPRGCGNTFHRLWIQAEQGINRFHTIKLPWYLHPERDQAWRDAQTKELGQKQASRECDCLGENTKITVEDYQGNIKIITMKELYQDLNNG